MKFIRILWGDFTKYESQIIDAKQDNLDEIVFVWGIENRDKLVSLGYECVLIDDKPYDYNIADAHTFINYRSLIHKIKAIGIALTLFEEVIFVDWDVRKIREVDCKFYEDIRKKNSSIQVPLYVYPKKAFCILDEEIEDASMRSFLQELQNYVKTYSYEVNDNYILPNTGFFYCNSPEIISELLSIIHELDLKTIPDELSVWVWCKRTLVEYIKTMEPSGIGAKEHGYDWWNKYEIDLLNYKKQYCHKDIYFEHL